MDQSRDRKRKWSSYSKRHLRRLTKQRTDEDLNNINELNFENSSTSYANHQVLSSIEDNLQNKFTSNQPHKEINNSSNISKEQETNATVTKFQEEVLRKLNVIITRVNALEEKIDALSGSASTTGSFAAGSSCAIDSCYAMGSSCSTGSSTSTDIMGRFPIKSLAEIEEFEKFICNAENRNKLVTILKLIGGKDVHHVVTKLLNRVLSNEVAVLYSYQGKRKKREFRTLRLTQLILETTRIHFPTVTEDVMGNSIASWLRYAQQRKGREIEITSTKKIPDVVQAPCISEIKVEPICISD